MTGPDWALGREGGEVLDVAVPEGDDALCCGAPKWYGASKQARPAGCRLARQEQRDPGGTALQESGDTGVSDGDGRARLERGCCLESWEMGDGRWEMMGRLSCGREGCWWSSEGGPYLVPGLKCRCCCCCCWLLSPLSACALTCEIREIRGVCSSRLPLSPDPVFPPYSPELLVFQSPGQTVECGPVCLPRLLPRPRTSTASDSSGRDVLI